MKFFTSALLLATVAIAAAAVVDADEPLPGARQGTAPLSKETTEQYSYAIGLEIGSSFAEGEIPLDAQSLLQGVRDALAGTDAKFSEQQCAQAMEALGEQRARAMIAAQSQFLEKNRTAEGVEQTASGLQYRVLTQGNGPKPTGADTVECHYRGRLIDGTVFDSSYEGGQPAVFPVEGVIDGWTEALQLMPVGSKWQLFVPSELAYGEDGIGGVIPPYATLVFEVELLGIKGQ